MFLLCFVHINLLAQEIHYADSIVKYNINRLNLNERGMKVLKIGGISSLAVGGIGYFAVNSDEWKYFAATNAACGLLNYGFSSLILNKIRNERNIKPTFKSLYRNYVEDKRMYLLSSGLDLAVAGIGVYMLQQKTGNTQLFKGVGNALCLQAVLKLLFDDIMFTQFVHSNSGWYQIMSDMQYIGNGVSFNYTFQY